MPTLKLFARRACRFSLASLSRSRASGAKSRESADKKKLSAIVCVSLRLKKDFARLSRKATRLLSGELRRGRQFMVPGGPVFALMSYASAGISWRKTTSRF